MARWILKPSVAKPFARKMGLTAQVLERTYKLVAERVPVDFDPRASASLREVETANDLKENAIVRADWIKPVERRFPGQRTAYLLLTLSGIDQANAALKGLTLAGRKVHVRRDLDEPKRCAKCQRYDNHFARECKAPHDTCANCAGAHPTSQCDTHDPNDYRCANCGVDGHAAWDRCCPTLRAKVSARITRKADGGFRFFVTNNPETWVAEDDELERAPPPPTIWSQTRPRAGYAGDPTRPRDRPTMQSRLDRYYGEPEQSTPTGLTE
ncbi:hypothetical protein L227DRAFT_584420 [Lentinus tigrinus ALCF2SS1-6]|uniref:CCHC-type domain-containing protein n=1 Tax=Lentinus tigrinus ALCF2SS1-6 TaxID=1328759 RepID=A0A5C2SL24_9APHY|nr:hypothetical protein L227DRAFT_584420 [Lentinus tigrinus ALCF2SS1-6]